MHILDVRRRVERRGLGKEKNIQDVQNVKDAAGCNKGGDDEYKSTGLSVEVRVVPLRTFDSG